MEQNMEIFSTGLRDLFSTYSNLRICNFLKNVLNRCTLMFIANMYWGVWGGGMARKMLQPV